MSEEVKLEVIKTTQDSLSKYIKKPPLTEKLLRKPPFRYLHDITTAVMRETGYLQGLYSKDELNPEKIKDREAKIAFLEKLITAVNLSTGVKITARPNKIVAGLDVAKTNELLQTIAKALDKNVDSTKAVEQILNKKSKGVSQLGNSKKETSKNKASKDEKTSETKSREPRKSDSLKKKIKDTVKTELKKQLPTKREPPEPVPSEQPSIEVPKDDSKPEETTNPEVPTKVLLGQSVESVTNSDTVQHTAEPKHDVKPPPPPSPQPAPPDNLDKDRQQDKENIPVEEKTEVKREEDSKLEEIKRPQSARAVHRRKSVTRKPSAEIDAKGPSKDDVSKEEPVQKEKQIIADAKDVTSKKPTQSEGAVVKERRERPKTAARPASARPGAPRVRDRGTVLLPDTDAKAVNESINLIVDSKDLPNDDDEALVTVETAPVEVLEQVMTDSQLTGVDQGHLVSQILETQKELEDTAMASSTTESIAKVDISWGNNRQEAVVKEVERLRTAIQALTRAANPLGKLIDSLQEDIESMQAELESWTQTNQRLSQQLQTEERLTEESIEPLARQLAEISQLVEEQLEETSIIKAVVIRNDQRITRLLSASTPLH